MYGLIYKIINDQNNLVYIGQTICSLEKRWRDHKQSALSKAQENKLYLAMRKIGLEHFTIIKIKEFEDITQEQLDEQEIYWIAYYNSFYNGYNSTKGGKIGYRNLIPILCYTLSGQFYKQYDTIGEAAGDINRNYNINITYDGILNCINNFKQDSCGGFQWKYQNSSKEIKDFSQLNNFNGKKCYFIQYDLKGNYINHYLTVKNASQMTNTQESGIIRCAKGEIKHSNSFIWKYGFLGETIPQKIKGLNINTKKGISKKIIYIDKNNNQIIYNSLSEAARKTGFSRNKITHNCNIYPKTTLLQGSFKYADI